jgi:hypothetical protein
MQRRDLLSKALTPLFRQPLRDVLQKHAVKYDLS